METQKQTTILNDQSQSDFQSTVDHNSLPISIPELKPKPQLHSESIKEKDSQSTSPSSNSNQPTDLQEKTAWKPKSTPQSESSSNSQENSQKHPAEPKKEKIKHQEEINPKRYKILAGNGCHQAIAEVQAMLMRPSQEGEKFKLILPDGFELDASFKNPRLKWLAYNKDTVIGLHWFRGYPKMSEGKLVCFQIIAWDGDMPTSSKGWETWEFIGLWTPQKNLTVQRSMTMKEIRSMAKETGFIKKFKYYFTNSREWVVNKKLWIGYVYKLICQREGDTLKIKKVIPFACPRVKPVPKGKTDFKGKKPKQDAQDDQLHNQK
jgi:hypothetical protein